MTNKDTFAAQDKNLDLNPDSKVYFLGLSHKLSKSGNMLEAFCRSTDSGKLINEILRKCNQDISIYKANLVKGAPLDANGKIRYPTEKEKMIGLQRLKKEIQVFKPKIVYLFGKQVSDFILKNLDVEKSDGSEYIFGNTVFMLAEHPSYMAVYKREYIDDYSSKIIDKINTIA